MIIKILFVCCLILYLIWRRLEKYSHLDYGHRSLNRLMGLNQVLCRHYHRLGDFWLDIPDSGGAIIAANHQSGMDPAVLIAASKRKIRFLTTSQYYDMPFAGYILRCAGCIPVYRNKDNSLALQKAIEALQNGEVVGIFPFGGIHLPYKPEPRIRSGVAVLSRLARVNIYPVYISGVAKFSYNKVFTSMFFLRSKLKLTPYSSIKNASEDDSVVLDQLYTLLSNHISRDTVTDTDKNIDKNIDSESVLT